MSGTKIPSDIEIARQATCWPIMEIVEQLAINKKHIIPFGRTKAKVSLDFLNERPKRKKSQLILVSAMTPTPAGEGKTTTSVGLCDAINLLGRKSIVCLREPSLGPCFGMKGGAAGGGYSQVIPMEDINLHFTGDFHAVSAAHNLLAAMTDNHLYFDNKLDFDPKQIALGRVLDMNDRALRSIKTGTGGAAKKIAHASSFAITAASEVMAILCLSESIAELRERLGKIVVGYSRSGSPITASDLKANGAMAVLLKDAIKPNLVQTLEGNPAFIHGGPFANIAHGCNSLVATKTALQLADYTITEAGFGADLGAEKFFDIKCRQGNLRPDAAVLVATIRALRWHGGAAREDLAKSNPQAVEKGLENLEKHIENIRKFNLPIFVAVNSFNGDTATEFRIVRQRCQQLGVPCIRASHWHDGGKGALELAQTIVDYLETAGHKNEFQFLYPNELSIKEKIQTVCRSIYGAKEVKFERKATERLKKLTALGFDTLPVCIAKTQYSFSNDPKQLGRPVDFTITVRDLLLSAGAGFIVAVTGEIMLMPGLPRVPSAEAIDIIPDSGNIVGLF